MAKKTRPVPQCLLSQSLLGSPLIYCSSVSVWSVIVLLSTRLHASWNSAMLGRAMASRASRLSTAPRKWPRVFSSDGVVAFASQAASCSPSICDITCMRAHHSWKTCMTQPLRVPRLPIYTWHAISWRESAGRQWGACTYCALHACHAEEVSQKLRVCAKACGLPHLIFRHTKLKRLAPAEHLEREDAHGPRIQRFGRADSGLATSVCSYHLWGCIHKAEAGRCA